MKITQNFLELRRELAEFASRASQGDSEIQAQALAEQSIKQAEMWTNVRFLPSPTQLFDQLAHR
jgi:hypothetical protein